MKQKRATVYFDADVYRALRLRNAACSRSISDMVNQEVPMTLAEDVDDLRDADQREGLCRPSWLSRFPVGWVGYGHYFAGL